jgi:hypothetical protein
LLFQLLARGLGLIARVLQGSDDQDDRRPVRLRD